MRAAECPAAAAAGGDEFKSSVETSLPAPLRFLAHHQTRTNIRAMSDDDEVVMEVQDGEGSPELELNGDGVTASGDAAVATGAAEPGSPPAAEPGSPPVSPLLKSALECVSQSSEEALLELERRIAERRRKLVGEPRTHGLRYKAVRRAQLRQTIDLESQKLGSLDEGDVVGAKEVAVNEAGIVRVLCATVDAEGTEVVRGWASAQSVESELAHQPQTALLLGSSCSLWPLPWPFLWI